MSANRSPLDKEPLVVELRKRVKELEAQVKHANDDARDAEQTVDELERKLERAIRVVGIAESRFNYFGDFDRGRFVPPTDDPFDVVFASLRP
jgi:chromosome segregation ATPase